MQEPGKNPLASPASWRDFPFNELVKRGYFADFSGSLVEARAKADELMGNLFSAFGYMPFNPVYCKRGGKTVDVKALKAWQARMLQIVSTQALPYYNRNEITDDFIQQVVRLSYYSQGPQMAVEILNKIGIHFAVLRHLPNTYLDGACFYAPDQRPVIGMTLRHDRLDNFWFTLAHELAHLYLHLDGRQKAFFDDTNDCSIEQIQPEEQQANGLARDWLIPPEIWEKNADELLKSNDENLLLTLANRLKIDPAIIAGRVRWESGDDRRFTALVGNGKLGELLDVYN